MTRIISEPFPLSEEQAQIVTARERYIKVIAGPGTGKTETLVRRLLYLLLCEDVSPENIIAFTFTEKAAQSMKNRVYYRLHEWGLDEHIQNLGSMYIGTIHSYCLHLLRQEFGYSDFNVLDENQEFALVFRIANRFNFPKGATEIDKYYYRQCVNFIDSVNVVHNELIDEQKLQEKSPEFYEDFREYEDFLDENRLLTFGRMISLTVRKLYCDREKINHVRYLMVDEYQDINKAQQELIQILGEGANVFVVGDPRQSIYQWRGSDNRFFEEFEQIFPGAKTFYMVRNRRSTPEIVNVANHFYQKFHQKYELIRAEKSSKGVALLASLPTAESEARWVVEEITRAVEEGKCRFKDCAILLRSVISNAGPFIRELRSRKIPYFLGGKSGLFSREEIKALKDIFFLLLKVKDEGQTPNEEDEVEDISRLQASLDSWVQAAGIELDKQATLQKLQHWSKKVLEGKYSNLTRAFHRLLVILGYRQLNPDFPLQAVVMANLGRFSSMLVDFETAMRLGGKKPEWPEIIKYLRLYVFWYAERVYEEQLAEDLPDIDAVFVGTVHQAKGLEWPVVFVSSVVGHRFPSIRAGKPRPWLISRELFDAERYEGSLEEEQNLFYVAITRAKEVLCVTAFEGYYRGSLYCRRSPSAFFECLREVVPVLGENQKIPFPEIPQNDEQKEPRVLSVREVADYLRCPHFYRLRNVWKYPPGLAEELGYGRSLRNCLFRLLELLREGEEKLVNAVERAIEEKFFLPFADQHTFTVLRKEAFSSLREFAQKYLEELLKIENTTTQVEVSFDGVVLRGGVDAVIREGERLTLWICRVSWGAITPEEVAFQLGVFIKASGLDSTSSLPRAFFANLGDSLLEEIVIDERGLQDVGEKLKEVLLKIKSGQFDKVLGGESCKRCDYSEICRFCYPNFS